MRSWDVGVSFAVPDEYGGGGDDRCTVARIDTNIVGCFPCTN